MMSPPSIMTNQNVVAAKPTLQPQSEKNSQSSAQDPNHSSLRSSNARGAGAYDDTQNQLCLKEVEAALEGAVPAVTEGTRLTRISRARSMIELNELAEIRDFDDHLCAMTAAEGKDEETAAATTAFPTEAATGDGEGSFEGGGDCFFFFDAEDDEEASFPPQSTDHSQSLAALPSESLNLTSSETAELGKEEDVRVSHEHIKDDAPEMTEHCEAVRFGDEDFYTTEHDEPVRYGDEEPEMTEHHEPVQFEPVKAAPKKQSSMNRSSSLTSLKRSSSMRSFFSGGENKLISRRHSHHDPSAMPKKSAMKRSTSTGALGEAGDRAPSDDSSGMKRNVSFHKLEMREYHLALGDNASCSNGPPVQLAWTYNKQNVVQIDIEEYESHREPRRSRAEMLVPNNVRWWRLMRESGYTARELKKAMESVEKTRNQRKQTRSQLVRQSKRNLKIQSAKRMVKGILK